MSFSSTSLFEPSSRSAAFYLYKFIFSHKLTLFHHFASHKIVEAQAEEKRRTGGGEAKNKRKIKQEGKMKI